MKNKNPLSMKARIIIQVVGWSVVTLIDVIIQWDSNDFWGSYNFFLALIIYTIGWILITLFSEWYKKSTYLDRIKK